MTDVLVANYADAEAVTAEVEDPVRGWCEDDTHWGAPQLSRVWAGELGPLLELTKADLLEEIDYALAEARPKELEWRTDGWVEAGAGQGRPHQVWRLYGLYVDGPSQPMWDFLGWIVIQRVALEGTE